MQRLLKLVGITIFFGGLTCLTQTADTVSSLCSLREITAQGKHVKVLVRGVLSIRPENWTLDDPACSDFPNSSTWVEFDLRSKSNERKLRDLLVHSQKVYLTSEGEFYGPPLPDAKLTGGLQKGLPPLWGHLGCCRTKLVVHAVREISPIQNTFLDKDTNPQNYYANAHPYSEEPLEQLRELVPELKGLQPSPDQNGLPMILQHAGQRVDSFFRDTPNLIADEYVREQEIRSIGPDYSIGADYSTGADHSIAVDYLAQEIRDEYLILLHGDRNETKFDEYRMDKKGKRINELSTGSPFRSRFFVTHGFALSCVYFSTAFQSESTFHYLGEQRIGSQNTYVVAFAQRPGHATMTETVRGAGHAVVQMLVQGVAWVDKSNFQIIKIQTDLLAPRPEVGLDRQTTEVTLGEVRLRDIASPLWLPKVVKVNIRFYGLDFRNEHHYANYRQYRVSSKMILPH
jgi:hypothetical protein